MACCSIILNPYRSESFVLNRMVKYFVNVRFSSSNNIKNNVAPLTLNNQESWHSLNAVSARELWALVDINFDKADSSLAMLLKHIGSNGFARATPSSVAINDSDSSVLIKEILNLIVCNCINMGRHLPENIFYKLKFLAICFIVDLFYC